jgi:GTP-binding protein
LLNRTLHDAIEERQPVSAAGHRLKFFYATQVRSAPPTFLLFVNRDELLSDQYTKYLSNRVRTAFGYEGCPIVLVPKPRPKTVESKGKGQPAGGRGKPNTKESRPAPRRRSDRSRRR